MTAALAQYPDGDHFVVFDNEDAARLYQGFVASALSDDSPTLDIE